MVTANSTLLTTIYQTDRMYVNFSVSEQRLLTMQRQLGRAPSQNSKTPPPFRIFLADGSEYPQTPRLNFIDPAVDSRTGTLALRLEVDNPQQLLHAGQFARVQVAAQQDPNAIVRAAARGPGSAGQELRLDRRRRRTGAAARRAHGAARRFRVAGAAGPQGRRRRGRRRRAARASPGARSRPRRCAAALRAEA